MCSVMHLVAILLASASIDGSGASLDEVAPTRIADLLPTTSPACSEPAAVRAEMPDPPGPPRKCPGYRQCKRPEGVRVGIVVPTVRLSSRRNDNRHQCAIWWAQSVASSLQLRHVSLQI
jgi:hypothetical protein